ncbi:MAG: tRNA pseudouridine(38-40) synthase TruA, partial [Actinobacteria bacterium]|nr:tRNA pseudouridine(38-40) synthase TruA [Actinomycetota bacterium]
MNQSLVRWRLDVAYDGTAFSGWAAPPGLRSVEGELTDWRGRGLRLREPPRR